MELLLETSFGVTCKIKAYGEVEVLQYVYLTSALDGDERSAFTLVSLPPGTNCQVPTKQEARWAAELVWTLWRTENCAACQRCSNKFVSEINEANVQIAHFENVYLLEADVST